VFVIVYGALRSGTTLLRLMLDMHPTLSCRGEADFLFDHLAFGPGDQPDLDLDGLRQGRIYQNSGVRINPDLAPREAILDMIGQMRSSEQDCVVVMLHRGIEHAMRLFPETPVLHMLRDPRDVARSSIGMGWAGTVYHGAAHWIRTEREWNGMMAGHPGTRTETLTYEALIADPQSELARVASFFGVAFDPAMLSYHEGSTYAPPDLSLVEQWKRRQTPQEVALIEGRLKDLLVARGYAPSGHDPIEPGAALKASLWIRNKSQVWKRRIGRFGVIDPVLVGLGKRLGIPALGRNARRRIDAKTVDYLK
jgi:hypothetical protein